MIKLKTWEMIKSITEDKTKRFKTSLGCHIVGLNSKGVLSWFAIHEREYEGGIYEGEMESDFLIGLTDYWSNLNTEWEEVIPEPVDFITAVNSGKRFRPESWIPGLIESTNDDHQYRDLCDNLMMFEGREMFNLNIINGKWYIEN